MESAATASRLGQPKKENHVSTKKGLVVGKLFRPPAGTPPNNWCYLIIDLSDDEVIRIRLHPSRVDVAEVGDQVRFNKPRLKDSRVRTLSRI